MLKLKNFLESFNDDDFFFVMNGTDIEDFRKRVASLIKTDKSILFTKVSGSEMFIKNENGKDFIPNISMCTIIKDWDSLIEKTYSFHYDTIHLIKIDDGTTYLLCALFFEDKL